MVQHPHARLYNGLPPVVRHRARRWLTISAFSVIAAAVIAIPVVAVVYATHAVPTGSWDGGARTAGGTGVVFNWYTLAWIVAAFSTGGLMGLTQARGWWRTLAVYVVGFGFWNALMFSNFGGGGDHQPLANISVGFLWMFGVAAGIGVRSLIQRRRVLRASYISQPG